MPLHRREPDQVSGDSAATRLRGWLIGAMVALNVVFAHLFAGQDQVSLAQAALAVGPLGIVALILILPRLNRIGGLIGLVGLSLLVLGTATVLHDRVSLLYLLQHLAVHIALAAFFLASLKPGRVPACTRFAEQVHDAMTPALNRYTRQVTWAWGLFFVINGAFSVALMALAGPAIWADYAVYATFPLVALMFVLEYLVRLGVLPREDLSSPWSAVIAYRRHVRESAERRSQP
ncbi:hypothetical protein D5687_04585 [Guyparkeria sp. SCN-R1]|uniref:hypothetical protein n=1 Tax=Guyparkeria sp. SCN-R1 TaxID=2341113 RepID=UPI000F6560A0|nr:hypothetical protein [Guyparkeria sp. SCN-R1]RRQ24015.1 hypothetical protein D5687_04585 [Guyparkeria sp. SCN-R1]